MRVKGLMPPEDGLSRETPTGRAVGKISAWHNFLCYSKICYALGHFYRNYPVTEKSRMFYGIDANRTSSILCFRLGIIEIFHPPYTPLVGAIVTWIFMWRQGKCDKIITCYILVCVIF